MIWAISQDKNLQATKKESWHLLRHRLGVQIKYFLNYKVI